MCVCVVWCVVCVGQVECDAGNENMSVSVRECRRQNFECGEECGEECVENGRYRLW